MVSVLVAELDKHQAQENLTMDSFGIRVESVFWLNEMTGEFPKCASISAQRLAVHLWFHSWVCEGDGWTDVIGKSGPLVYVLPQRPDPHII